MKAARSNDGRAARVRKAQERIEPLVLSPANLLQIGISISILAGFGATWSYFPPRDRLAYAAWTVLSVGAAYLFGASLGRSGPLRVLRWVVFMLFFLGYYLQFWWLILDDRAGDYVHEVVAGAIDPQRMLQAFRLVSLAFAGAAALVTVMDRVPLVARQAPSLVPAASARIGNLATKVAAVLASGLVLLMGAHGIGLMNAVPEELPFRIAGWSVWSLRVLVPGLALLGILMAERSGDNRAKRFGLVALFGPGLGDLLVTTSKMGIVMALVRYTLMLALLGVLTRPRIQRITLLALVLALLFPFFGVLRIARVEGAGVGEALTVARRSAANENQGALGLVLPAVFRVSGLANLLPLMNEVEPRPELALSGLVGGPGIGFYTTYVIYGFEPNAPVGMAPGLFGWLWVAVGESELVVGLLALLLLGEMLWRSVVTLPLVTRPIALVLFLTVTVAFVTDGILEASSFIGLAAAAGTVLVVELMARSVTDGGEAPVAPKP